MQYLATATLSHGEVITYLVNSSQGLAASYKYDAYGNLVSQSGSLAGANVYRFSSKEWLATPGLYYYGYRWYAPTLQRWPNRDPIGEQGGVNLYQFAINDSVNIVDLHGLSPGDFVDPLPPAPVFDPSGWTNENCLAYALNRRCDGDMFPGNGQTDYTNCDSLKQALKDNHFAIEPVASKCPPGYHKIRVYPGFHIQRQDSDGKWSEKNRGHPPRRCITSAFGNPIDRPQDVGVRPAKACKGDLCVPH